MTHPVILAACEKHKITTAEFFGKRRTRALMECRSEAARIFRDRGNSWVATARLLRRSRDTARYWLDPNVRKVRMEYMLKRWHEVYKHEHHL